MPNVVFIMPDGSEKKIDAPEGWSLMQIAVDNGIEQIEGACGGAMACATCHVYVHPDWVEKVADEDNEKSAEEEDMLDLAFELRPSSRLGCQIKMSKALDGLVVALPGAKAGW